MPRHIAIFLLITYSVFLFLDELYNIYVISFYFYLLFLIVDVVLRKSFSLSQLWVISFLYIINSEGVLDYGILRGSPNSVVATRVIYASNVVFLIGFYINNKNKTLVVRSLKSFVLKKKTSGYFLVTLVLLYFLWNISFAISAYSMGRYAAWGQSDNGFIFSLVNNGMGLVLPAFVAYVYKVKNDKSSLWQFLLVLPVFAILLMEGTRFYLLFSFLGFFMVYFNYKKIRFVDSLYLISFALILYIAAKVMIGIRGSGGSAIAAALHVINGNVNDQTKDFVVFLSEKMSPEGVISAFSKMVEYFNRHEYLYGESTGFVFYFWIPRVIWHSKPTMLGHWLIREYGDTGFSSGHSASFGFCGDFYADFGVIGAVLLSGVLGYYMKYLDNYSKFVKNNESPYEIIGAMIYPYVFFSVRSPITSTMTFILIIAMYFIIRRLLFITVKTKDSQIMRIRF